jgi:hypothetical protein
MLAGSQEYFVTRGGGTIDGFLDALYGDILNRPVDGSGRATFDLAFAHRATTSQIAATLFASPEYQHDLVESLYEQFLHREADNTGLGVFMGLLNNGTHDSAVIAAILASAEYAAAL